MHHGKGECNTGHVMLLKRMHGDGCYDGRHFPTKKEKIEKLEKYQEWLENEAQGVKEAIEGLSKE